MKRKTRFNDGGMNNPYQGDDIDPFSAVRDASGSTDPRQEGPSSEALFDETSGRELSIRRNLDTGEYYFTEPPAQKAAPAARAMPKAPAIKPAAGSGRGTAAGRTAADVDTYIPGRGGIPTDQSIKAPASTGESTSGMSNMDKLMAGIPAGMGMTRFLQAASRGLANTLRTREAMKQAAQANAKQIGEGRKMLESPGKFKQRELDAERAARAAKREKERVAENAAAEATGRARATAEAMEKAKPTLQARKDTKPARAARTRRTEEDMGIEFSKGGMASRRADGCAQRGKTRGKIY